jgi:hypothetical protein
MDGDLGRQVPALIAVFELAPHPLFYRTIRRSLGSWWIWAPHGRP